MIELKTQDEPIEGYPYQLTEWADKSEDVQFAYDQIAEHDPDYCVMAKCGDKYSVWTKGRLAKSQMELNKISIADIAEQDKKPLTSDVDVV